MQELRRGGVRERGARRAEARTMSDTTIIEMPPSNDAGATPFSWSAAIAGAVAATAVVFIVVALGAGIGLPFASPFGSGPSATTLTVAAAVWLVMAQSLGFAAGGYLAGRLRSPAHDGVIGETAFRDAAQGFMVWAIGVVAMVAIAMAAGFFAAGATARIAAGAAAGAAAKNDTSATASTAPVDYFVDVMFRPRPGEPGAAPGSAADTVGRAPAGSEPTLSDATRAEVTRIVLRGVQQAQLDEADRAYLARVVAARTGLSPDEAQRRVVETEGKAREAVKEAGDKAAKAGAYFAFWSFMSLLFGAAAATLAAMLGGQLRDAEGRAA
jgi:hypothetical protein